MHRVERAKSPAAPVLSRSARQRADKAKAHVQEREALESRSVLRGLLLLAAIVILISLVGDGLGRAFFAGWWRHW